MDPISVIASITGILTAAVQISSSASSLLSRWKEAPRSIHSIVAEMTALGSCVVQLKPYLEDLDSMPRERTEIISVEQIMVLTSSCVLAISELQKVLESFDPEKTLTVSKKVWWTLHEKKINTLRSRVQASTTSLNFILTVITCSNTEESRQSIRKLEKQLDHVLNTDTDLYSRFANANLQGNSSRYAAGTGDTGLDTPDDASTITVKTIDPSKGVVSEVRRNLVFGLDPDIEHGLANSGVYLRAAGGHSLSSLPSMPVSGSRFGWSFCSHFSLAQLSSISVLSLPISSMELWKPKQYIVPTESDTYIDYGRLKLTSADRPVNRTDVMFPASKFRTGSYRIILEQTSLISHDFKNFRESHNITRRDLETIISSNLWIHDLACRYDISRTSYFDRKALLLGTVENKSAFLRQMFTKYRKTPTHIDRLLHRIDIRSNLWGVFMCMIIICKAQGFIYTNPGSFEYEETIIQARPGTEGGFSPDLITALKGIWHEECIARAFTLLAGFPVRDNFPRFFHEIDRIASVAYMPTNDDIFCTYSITHGVSECFFSLTDYDTNRNIHILDPDEDEGISAIGQADIVISIASDPGFTTDLMSPVQTVLSRFRSTLKHSGFHQSKLILIVNTNTDHQHLISVEAIRFAITSWKRWFREAALQEDRSIIVLELDLEDEEETKRILDSIFLEIRRPSLQFAASISIPDPPLPGIGHLLLPLGI